MLDHTVDLGAQAFMQADVGLGLFVARAGDNRVMLHQAANDGFRGLYVVCFDGPEYHQRGGPCGYVVNSNGDNEAALLNTAVSVAVLRDVLKLSGMDWARVERNRFSAEGLTQDEIVNQCFKRLVLEACVDPVAAPGPDSITTDVLTRESFRHFGDVIAFPGLGEQKGIELSAANAGTAVQAKWLATLANARENLSMGAVDGGGAKANVAVFRCSPRGLQSKGGKEIFRLTEMERHPYSSQAFVPMAGQGMPVRYLVMVATGLGARPDLRTLKAFVVNGGAGVNYGAGVWHSPLVCLDNPTDFACITYADGSAEDCHLVELASSIDVFLPSTTAVTTTVTTTTGTVASVEPEIKMVVAPSTPSTKVRIL
jgi:ureidoglycolate hydrolase